MTTIAISKFVSSAVACSPRVLETAAMFGLGVDEARQMAIVPACRVPLPHLFGSSGIVLITGPSGSGKSTILKLLAEALGDGPARVLQFDGLPALRDVPLVDVFDWPGMTLEKTLATLSIVGLGDAFVMLRRPMELSDGQRHRLRLAQVISEVMRGEEKTVADYSDASDRAAVILADEFTSTLDRVTAQTICRNIRRWMDRWNGPALSFVVATAHDDVLDALQPDVLVWKGLGDEVEVLTR